jgi:hypothetical protein
MFDKIEIISKKYCLCQEKFNAGQGDVKVNSKPLAAEVFLRQKNSKFQAPKYKKITNFNFQWPKQSPQSHRIA